MIFNNSRNCTMHESENEAISPTVSAILVVFYAVIFIIAFFGNLMAIITCYASYRRTTSILLCYIASLATADLLFTLLGTVDLVYFLSRDWPGGEAVCKIHRFLMETSYSASILTLAGISYERYKAVVLQGRSKLKRHQKRSYIVKVVWIASILTCAPLLYGYTITMHKDGKKHCENGIVWGSKGRMIYYGLTAVVKFILPVAWMIRANWSISRALASHNRNNKFSTLEAKQRKVTKMLVVVTLIFCCCWTPAVVIRLLDYFVGYERPLRWRLVQLLFFTNCALNPVLYCFYDRQFRSSFKRIMSLRWKRPQRTVKRLWMTEPNQERHEL